MHCCLERNFMNKHSIPIHFLLACIFLYCFNALYHSSSIYSVYANYNVFTLPILTGLTFILFKGSIIYLHSSKRHTAFLLCGLLFGTFFVFGTKLMINGQISFSSPFLWVCILIFSYVMTAFLVCIEKFFLPVLHKYFIEQKFPHLEKISSKLSFPLLWLIIFLCWMPVLLACYPGIFSYDAIYQCSQVGDILQLNDHHPIVHTLLLGSCVQFGRTVLENANTGMLLYSLIQMLITSCIFAYVLTFLKKNKVSSLIQLLCLLFFALVPFNSLFSICATKDTIFSALFVLFFIQFSKLALYTNTFFQTWKRPIYIAFTMFLLLIFRKNMLYAFLFCLPFLLISFRIYWKKNLIMLLTPILLLQLYQAILYPALRVTPGNSREAYSVIIQQFGCVYNNCELDLTEKDMLLTIMAEEDWQKYEPHRSDILKDQFNTEAFESDLSTYIKLWLSLGLKHPSQYLNAFLNLTYGYWYPNDVLPDTTTYRKYIEVYTGADITFDSKFPWLLEKLTAFGMESTYQVLPGISMLFSPAIYIWILFFLGAHCFCHKKRQYFLLILPLISLFLTLLLGPVALLRYLYPIILCVPIICSMIPVMQIPGESGNIV